MAMMKKVLVGMSGGVDSSVAALLLKRQGYEVEGVFMQNWNPSLDDASDPKSESSPCSVEKDYNDAADVCHSLGIRLRRVSFEREYWTEVFEKTLAEINEGYMPNPDILCNRYIKFSKLTDYAFNTAGADLLATGHYARLLPEYEPTSPPGWRRLYRAIDPLKDQSYFLGAVKEDSLQRVLFPLGNLRKTTIRKIAQEANLITAKKRDSTGICFIGNSPGHFSNFLARYIPEQPGFYDIPLPTRELAHVPGSQLRLIAKAQHMGAKFYTIGSRARISGLANRWYICDKDVKANILYITEGADSPQLSSFNLKASHPVWLNNDTAEENIKLIDSAKIKSTGDPFSLSEIKIRGDSLRVIFQEPQVAISPGQIIVFYALDRVIGSARIEYETKRVREF